MDTTHLRGLLANKATKILRVFACHCIGPLLVVLEELGEGVRARRAAVRAMAALARPIVALKRELAAGRDPSMYSACVRAREESGCQA